MRRSAAKMGFALRTTVYESIRYSPDYFNFGRDLVISGKCHRIEHANNEVEFADRRTLSEHVKSVQALCAEVRERLIGRIVKVHLGIISVDDLLF